MRRRYKDKEKERIERLYPPLKYAYEAFIAVYPFDIEDLEGEFWKWISGFEGLYQISNYARVKSFPRGNYKKVKILKPVLTPQGYLRVILRNGNKNKTIRIHRLVALAFIPNPENKPEVNHIDGNKFNNCVENLEWNTDTENKRHAIATGLQKTGAENPKAKLTAEDVRRIRKDYKPYDRKHSINTLAKKIWSILFSYFEYNSQRNLQKR